MARIDDHEVWLRAHAAAILDHDKQMHEIRGMLGQIAAMQMSSEDRLEKLRQEVDKLTRALRGGNGSGGPG